MTQVSIKRCCETKTRVLRIHPCIRGEPSIRMTAWKLCNQGSIEEHRRYICLHRQCVGRKVEV